MARRIPKFNVPTQWDESRRKRTLDLAEKLDKLVWETLQKKKFEDWHSYSLLGPEKVLEDLKECFTYIPSARAHLRGTMKIRALITNFGGESSNRDAADHIVLDGELGRTRIYFTDHPEDIHDIYVRMREDGMSSAAAEKTAVAVLA